nr:uncharacterized protein LOC124806670 [Hydra vulgaris]
MHNLKPGPEYYMLLKSAKSYKLQDPSESPSKIKEKYKSFSPATISTVTKDQLQVDFNIQTQIATDPFEREELIKSDSKEEELRKSDQVLSSHLSTESTEPSVVDFVTFNNKNEIGDIQSDAFDEDDNNDDDGDYIPSEQESDEETLKKLSPSIEDLLNDFYHYLTGPDRARKSRSIERVKNDVKRIFLAVGLTNSIKLLFENDTDVIRKNYLQVYCVNRKLEAGSIKTYLNSLKDFCSYLIKSKYREFDLSFETIFQTILNIENWRKNYRAKDSIRKHKRAEDDLLMLVTPEQVKKYEQSKNASTAKKLLEDLKNNPNKELTMFDYCCYRDHVFFIIHFASAHRSGVTANMTMEEFFKMKVFKDGMKMINVWDHKTVSTYGPARVTLNSIEFEWIEVFVNHVRTKLPAIHSDKVFLSWSGKEMSSGDISGRLHSLWVKAGNFDGRFVPKKLSANIVRKTTSTLVRNSEFYKDRGVVADSMMHSELTAATHYHTRSQELNAITGGNIVRKNFCRSPLTKTDEVDKSSLTEEKNDQLLTSENLLSKNDFSFSLMNTPKKIWSKEETSSLNLLFPDNKSQNISYNQVKSMLAKSPSINSSPRQVYDKLKRMKRKYLEDMPEESKVKKNLQFERKTWSSEQINELKVNGKELILGGPLSRSRILSVLKNSKLLKDFTITQLRTRINHERN